MENRNAGSTAAGANDREQSYTEAPRAVKPEELKYNSDGLIPAVIQDAGTGAVLMVGYMNQESLRRTIDSGKVCFWSRSRKVYWVKGESSGNFFEVAELYTDCDVDTLLIKVRVHGKGVACHTGRYSCFYNSIDGFDLQSSGEGRA
jgi:phosphoribosyl-AMP cyclohydrolase